MDEQSTSDNSDFIQNKQGALELHCAQLKYNNTEGIHDIKQCLGASVPQTGLPVVISNGCKQQNHFQVVLYKITEWSWLGGTIKLTSFYFHPTWP